MTTEIQDTPNPAAAEKSVRVTLELPNSFLKLLNAKATLKGWFKLDPSIDHGDDAECPELDAGAIVAWLVLMEARGGTPEQIHACTPMMWRQAGGPELVHDERRVYQGGNQIAGPKLILEPTETT